MKLYLVLTWPGSIPRDETTPTPFRAFRAFSRGEALRKARTVTQPLPDDLRLSLTDGDLTWLGTVEELEGSPVRQQWLGALPAEAAHIALLSGP